MTPRTLLASSTTAHAAWAVRLALILMIVVATLASTPLGRAGEPELAVTTPVQTPIRHRPFWRLEPELFGYHPRFTPGVITFDPENRPYIRAERVIQTVDSAGNWVRVNYPDAVLEQYPDWDGQFQTGAFADEHVVFDDEGDAYTLVNARRSSIKRVLLLHSRDACRTWRVYPFDFDSARIERPDGHNDLSRPPAILLHDNGRTGILLLVLPAKGKDGDLTIPEPRLVTRDSLLVANHSGAGNSVISRGNAVHIVWPGRTAVPGREKAGTPQYAASYDRRTGKLTDPVLLGFGGTGAPDAHNIPAIAADSKGALHVVFGAHHDPFLYTRSLKPDSVAAWTAPVTFGVPKRTPNEGSYTYASWLCDRDDTLHCVARWAGNGYTFRLVYLRKRADDAWDDQQVLVKPFAGNYSIYYHKLNMDRRGRLFVNTLYTRAARYADEIAAYSKKWPQGDPEVSFIKMNPSLLLSDDAGSTWRLAQTPDLMPGAGTRTVGASPDAAGPEPDDAASAPAPVSARVLQQFGGAIGPLAQAGSTIYAASGNRLLILDGAEATELVPLGQAAPLKDAVMRIEVELPRVWVAARRAGLLVYDVTDPRRPALVTAECGTEAFGFERVGAHLFLCAGSKGLRVLRCGQTGELNEAALLPLGTAYDIAIADDIAYVAMGAQGLTLVDISKPSAPEQVACLLKPADYGDRQNTAWRLHREGTLLYVSPGPGSVALRIFDISDRRHPSETAQLERPWGWGRQVVSRPPLLFVCSLQGLRILDISDPASPRERSSFAEEAAVLSCTVDGDRVYASAGAEGVFVLDVSSPDTPTCIGRYEQPKTPWSIAVSGDLACIADWDVGLHVYDLSGDGFPRRVGGLRRPHWAYGVALEGDCAFVAAGRHGLHILDLTDPAMPQELGVLPTDTGFRDVAVHDGKAFVAEAEVGIRVIGISAPEAPRTTAVLPTDRECLGLTAAGKQLFAGQAQRVTGGLRAFRAGWFGRMRPTWTLATASDVWDLAVHKRRLFACLGPDGIHVLHISPRGGPTVRGQLHLPGGAAWSAAVHGDRLFVMHGQNGFSVIDVNSLAIANADMSP